MARPQRLHLNGRYWRVVETDLAPMGAVGLSDDATGTISLHPGQSPWAERDTVLHELMHSVLRSQGRPYDEAQEELYVGALATGLLGALRANPAAARYLFLEKLS